MRADMWQMPRPLPRTRPRVSALLLAVGLLLATAVPAGAATESPVATGPANQFGPSATDGWVSWAQPVSRVFRTMVKPDAGPAVAVNRNGTTGYGGGFDGSVLTYQQVPKKSTDSGVYTYDVDTQARGVVTAANTKFWEWEPTASGDWVLVARNNSNTKASKLWHRIILVNTATEEKRVLAEATGKKVSLRAGQVNADTASWEKCTSTDCQAIFYDITSRSTTTISTSALDSSPSVAPDGTWYFFRSGAVCGQNVRIYRQEPEDPTPTLIHSMPNGTYAGDAYVASNGSGEALYYARATCSSPKLDVYVIEGADTATEAAPLTPSAAAGPKASAVDSPGPGPLARIRAMHPEWAAPGTT